MIKDTPLKTAAFEDLAEDTKKDLEAAFALAQDRALEIFKREAAKGKSVEEIMGIIEREL